MNTITTAQMAELDRIMIEEMGIDIPIMMEHAAVAAAQASAKLCDGKRILILCGHGHNGGDGLAAARHLYNWGYTISIISASPKAKCREDTMKQWNILERMGIAVAMPYEHHDFTAHDLIIDGLLGYNVKGNPRDAFSTLIDQANHSGVPILSIDVPSGLNATTGEVGDPHIRASATVALSAVKTGLFKNPESAGRLFVSYMSVPPQLYEKFGVKQDFTAHKTLCEVK